MRRKAYRQMIRINDVCELIGLSPSTVRQIMDTDSKFPMPYLIAKSRLWDKGEVDRWFAGCRVKRKSRGDNSTSLLAPQSPVA